MGGSGNKDLSISSTNGAVNVEGAKFTGNSINQGAGDGALTVEGVTLEDGAIGSAAIEATGSITSSKSSGGLLLTSTDAQVITHTGTGSGNKDLSISSTNGAVNVEDMKFTGSDVTSAGAVTLTSSGSTVSVEGTKFAGDSIDQGAGDGALTVEGVTLQDGALEASESIT